MKSGYEATHLLAQGALDVQILYGQLLDTKALLFHTPEAEQSELRAEVGRLTQEIRRKLREKHYANAPRGVASA